MLVGFALAKLLEKPRRPPKPKNLVTRPISAKLGKKVSFDISRGILEKVHGLVMNGSEDYDKETLRKISASLHMTALRLTVSSAEELCLALKQTVEDFYVRSRKERTMFKEEDLVVLSVQHSVGPCFVGYTVPPIG